ncbi:hypothetical protein BDP27DRAFT_1281174 [Rhodocollybia butyracea]|uniref:Amidohydrolase-related domain-containing protein n=1 Tax=Rhodocollybia butyracea TaxID=206335 RepID=A0A9P5QAY7_9AGAR|nr:hypothetical protein BDP27DRAFT_1281174 [Rhodocollybia butyracea]
MRTYRITVLIGVIFSLCCTGQTSFNSSNIFDRILHNAAADGIHLSALNFTDLVLREIVGIYDSAICSDNSSSKGGNGSRIDVHNHLVPDWYRSLVPVTGGNPTPQWNISSTFSFMESEDIGRSVLSFSSPGAAVFPGNRAKTLALARLMNEETAAYARSFTDKLSFMAVVPFPYINESIQEARYALDELGAAGLVLLSSFEGKYLGDPAFAEFFRAVNGREGRQIIFVHPGTPYLIVNGELVEANPTRYPTGFLEFYFETARTFQDLTVTQTLHNLSNLHWIVPHAGGAYPTIIDRILFGSFPALVNDTYDIMKTRLWYDTAGPTFLHQVGGLLAYDVSDSQILFGTDFPYVPQLSQPGSLQAILDSDFIDDAGKEGVFSMNAKGLFRENLFDQGCLH